MAAPDEEVAPLRTTDVIAQVEANNQTQQLSTALLLAAFVVTGVLARRFIQQAQANCKSNFIGLTPAKPRRFVLFDPLLRTIRVFTPAAPSRQVQTVCFAAGACFIGYYQRAVLSVVIIGMAEEFGWQGADTGRALGSFYYGYVIANLTGPFVLRRANTAMLFIVAIFGSSTVTMMLPGFVALWGVNGLMLNRAFAGLLQGLLFPICYAFISAEFRSNEAGRTRAASTLTFVVNFGVAVNFFVSPFLVQSSGWKNAVNVAGALGVPWCILWMLSPFVRDPAVPQAKELEGAEESEGKPIVGSETSVRDVLCAAPFYGMVCAHFSHAWMSYVMLAWLPTYLREELDVGGKSLATSSLPYLATAMLSPLLCLLGPGLLQKRGLDLWAVRRTLALTGLLVPATGLIILPRVPKEHWQLALLDVGVILVFSTLTSVSVLSTPLDIAGPRMSGVLYSMSNTVAAVPGFGGVQLVGWLRTCCGWPVALGSCVVFYAFGAVMYTRLGHARRIFE